MKDGYRLSDAVGVTLAQSTTLEANLVCVPDQSLSLGAIAGVLTVDTGLGVRTPLAGAKITLTDAGGTVLAHTYTADDGEFVFYDVQDGTYSLMATAEGYLATAPVLAVVTGGSVANIDMVTAADSRSYSGTVSGVIRDTARPCGGPGALWACIRW